MYITQSCNQLGENDDMHVAGMLNPLKNLLLLLIYQTSYIPQHHHINSKIKKVEEIYSIPLFQCQDSSVYSIIKLHIISVSTKHF